MTITYLGHRLIGGKLIPMFTTRRSTAYSASVTLPQITDAHSPAPGS